MSISGMREWRGPIKQQHTQATSPKHGRNQPDDQNTNNEAQIWLPQNGFAQKIGVFCDMSPKFAEARGGCAFFRFLKPHSGANIYSQTPTATRALCAHDAHLHPLPAAAAGARCGESLERHFNSTFVTWCCVHR